jgi:hypothetical protein
MPRKNHTGPVKLAFQRESRRIAIDAIQPLRLVTPTVKKTMKYGRIAASIREVGIIEPPVVVPDRSARGKFLLLDGHLRIEALRDEGETEVVCLVSTEDEASTYNKRISRLAIIQEHRMILKALERGVDEQRLARALNLDIKPLRHKKTLLNGICPEAVELLKDKHVPEHTFFVLRKMNPMRQIEAAELMVAVNKFTTSYARSLLAATPRLQLAGDGEPKVVKGLTEEQMALMERESAQLDQAFKMAEQSYGADHLHLVLAKGYLGRIVGNARVTDYLARHHREILAEFRAIVGADSAAA